MVTGTLLVTLSSIAGGLATTSGMLIGARLAQGAGAALMLPGALSILTTMFKEGGDRNKALGVWGGVGAAASAAGVLLGGLLTDGPGWRWVMLVNAPVCALVIAGLFLLVEGDRRSARLANFDVLGTALVTGGMLLLVFTLVKAPEVGWDAARTIGGLAAPPSSCWRSCSTSSAAATRCCRCRSSGSRASRRRTSPSSSRSPGSCRCSSSSASTW
ncbi:MFS transporter [Actinomadura madurae]|uniref:MFS transporter n=1 Tax=Actinomadura madurae TaxID=1993 RepID=UPI003558DFAC